VLAAMGLTVSDAVPLMLTRVAREHALPFDPLIPNAITVAAMMEGQSTWVRVVVRHDPHPRRRASRPLPRRAREVYARRSFDHLDLRLA